MSEQSRINAVFSRIAAYVKSLELAGGLLTLLGLAPLLVDYGASLTGRDFNIPPWLAVLWLFLCFGVANFRVFEAHTRRDVEFVVKRQSFVMNDWLQTSDGSFVLNHKPV